jgi:hypothetical protein
VRALLVLAAIAAAAILACVVTAEEVARGGDLLPYPSAEVVKYEVLGGLTVYVETEPVGGWDLLDAGLLALVAAVAGAGWLAMRPARVRAARLLAIVALLGVGLGVDEAFALHETVGHNLPFLAALPGVERPDDAIVVLGALVLAAAGVASWRTLGRVPVALAVFAFAGLGVLVAALGDPLGFVYEEQLEVLAAGLVLLATLLLVRGLWLAESSSESIASSRAQSTPMSSLRANRAAERRSSGRSARRRVSGDAPPVQRI